MIHPLALNVAKSVWGSYGGSPFNAVDNIDQEIRKWLEEKVKIIFKQETITQSWPANARRALELDQPKEWCQHVFPFGHRKEYHLNDSENEPNAQPWPEIRNSWNFCPICGARRP